MRIRIIMNTHQPDEKMPEGKMKVPMMPMMNPVISGCNISYSFGSMK